MYSLGIDAGYSSVKVALMKDDEIVQSEYALHRGKIRECLLSLLERTGAASYAARLDRGAATGSGAKFLFRYGIAHVNEVTALVEGTKLLAPHCNSIVEIGGEGAKFVGGWKEESEGGLRVAMNSNCSAGTGSFLEEQMSRLDLRLEDYSKLVSRAVSIPRIAGRCSVFAKTDIVHHQQEGVPVEDILLGVAYALVNNFRASVVKGLPVAKPVFFAGGVAFNEGIVSAMRRVFELDEESLFLSPLSGSAGAVGAGAVAAKESLALDAADFLERLRSSERLGDIRTEESSALPSLRAYGTGDSVGKHRCATPKTSAEPVPCWLGVDVGSTSTNLVLMTREHEIVAYKYLKTLGNPVQAIRDGFSELRREHEGRVRIEGAGATGSGRRMIGELIGADVVKDEITAQAKAAAFLFKDVDTVFEIGGQDSKYIGLKNGVVADFQMNRVCAAGTGSFIEEQAKKFGIPVERFGETALAGDAPLNLGERCAVFIESSVASALMDGASLENIASGLCYSIAKNYLNRVVGKKKIGEKILLQGGIAFNQGVVNAFRAATGKEIVVPPFFSVTGAYGVALLAKEEMEAGKSRFKGLRMFEAAGEPVAARPEERAPATAEGARRFDEKVSALIFKGYDGVLHPSKKTVGIPRGLFTYGMFPMFSEFFKELGFNVLLSDPTNEETVRRGQEYSRDELCYPLKLLTGHVAELVEKKTDFIFFPDLHSVMHPDSHTRQNYGCAYMQLAFKLISDTMGLSEKGITLLAPTIAFNRGPEFMRKSFCALGGLLGRTGEETERALRKGMEGFLDFERRAKENAKNEIAKIAPDEKVFVIISKIYGVADPVLNLGIPGKLMDMGYRTLSFFDLPEGDISGEHPNMYWPFGQHILEPVKLIREHPNMYAVFLTHHCCGPDSMLLHYFRELAGEKPYLNIEVDEHSSSVGVLTRIEAFINSLSGRKTHVAAPVEEYVRTLPSSPCRMLRSLDELDGKTTVFLPFLYPYSSLLEALLRARGVDAEELPEPDGATLDEGRAQTLTNELLSLTVLLGSLFRKARERAGKPSAFFIPQTEGAEVDGQYARLARMLLDEKGYGGAEIVAPFLEDGPEANAELLSAVFSCVAAGDAVLAAPLRSRKEYLRRMRGVVSARGVAPEALRRIGEDIAEEWRGLEEPLSIFAVGEASVLYNDFLNNFMLRTMEEKDGHRVVRAPLSECLWFFWNDALPLLSSEARNTSAHLLDEFAGTMRSLSDALSLYTPFSESSETLANDADALTGLYCGAFGRYRAARTLRSPEAVRGVVTLSSTYENTGILLNALDRKRYETAKPILDLTFDGGFGENDRVKLESFVHYLKRERECPLAR